MASRCLLCLEILSHRWASLSLCLILCVRRTDDITPKFRVHCKDERKRQELVGVAAASLLASGCIGIDVS
jgi:hypothetical protein